MEIDSDPCVSVISEDFYGRMINNVELLPNNLILSSYTQNQIKPAVQLKGYCNIP